MNKPIPTEGENSSSFTKRQVTLFLCSGTGFLVSILLLKDRDYSISYRNFIEHFIKWIINAHSNNYVMILTPAIFFLLGIIAYRFIDYYKEK